MDNTQRWAVMILAHNEEERIVACLDSLYRGEPGKPIDAYVMANGCTDRTEDLVRAYAATQPAVHLVSIRLGDKNNAWNVFVHETVSAACPDREVYFFMDGDAMIAPGSLSALAQALRNDPVAHAASAVPGSGRNMERDRKEILELRGLVANLYGLRGSFVQRLRDKRVRLPLNLEGDDGLIGALIKWNLDPPAGPYNHALIHPCADAQFLFEPVSMLQPREWPKYWKRLVRYGRRYYEFQLLGPLLKEKGMAGMPANIRDIYPGAVRLPFVWRGMQTPAFFMALQQMRRIGRHRA